MTPFHSQAIFPVYSRYLKVLEQYYQHCMHKILRIHWEGRCTNTNILDQANIPSVEELTTLDQPRWTGHIVRMADKRLPKQETSDGKWVKYERARTTLITTTHSSTIHT
eukprot:g42072.t1